VKQWDSAQRRLRAAGEHVLQETRLRLVEALGEAAFYGPKLDLQVTDDRGHEETIATVQLDFNQPERFDLTYRGADAALHRVVMIHRGTVGSMERVVAALPERCQGRLPFWLAPTQIAVLPVTTKDDGHARDLLDRVRALGLRARTEHDGSLGARIRAARLRRDHLIGVIGEREIRHHTVQVTDASAHVRTTIAAAELLHRMTTAYHARHPHIDWPP